MHTNFPLITPDNTVKILYTDLQNNITERYVVFLHRFLDCFKDPKNPNVKVWCLRDNDFKAFDIFRISKFIPEEDISRDKITELIYREFYNTDIIKKALEFNNDCYILHVCNNLGGWGKGFSGALSSVCFSPEYAYRSSNFSKMGTVSYSFFNTNYNFNNIIVANMVCQNGYKSDSNPIPLSYPHLKSCLIDVYNNMKQDRLAPILMPKIGSGLAGGDWNIISSMIKSIFCDKGIPVIVGIL